MIGVDLQFFQISYKTTSPHPMSLNEKIQMATLCIIVLFVPKFSDNIPAINKVEKKPTYSPVSSSSLPTFHTKYIITMYVVKQKAYNCYLPILVALHRNND